MNSLATFREITPLLHFLMILLVIGLSVFVSIAGTQATRQNRQKQFSTGFGISLLCIWVIYNIYYFLPINFKPALSLPLHMCDVLTVVAVFSLIKPNRKTSAILYFCALALAGQAIITPVGNQNPAVLRFWLFWFLHAGLIAASVYDLVVRKYRPVFKDYLFAVAGVLLYIVIILPIDIIFGWNYGYIGNQPSGSATIEALGAWPQRLVLMFAFVFFIQFIMYLPWKFFGKKN